MCESWYLGLEGINSSGNGKKENESNIKWRNLQDAILSRLERKSQEALTQYEHENLVNAGSTRRK